MRRYVVVEFTGMEQYPGHVHDIVLGVLCQKGVNALVISLNSAQALEEYAAGEVDGEEEER